MHRLGSVLPLASPVVIGPGSMLPPTVGNTWQVAFPVDPLAKFVMLHFDGTALVSTDRVEIDLGYDTDVYTAAWGPDFWSRPIRGDLAVTIRYVSSGSGTGSVRLDKYGRGEAMKDGGLNNTNADVFLLDSPYVEPPYFAPEGAVPPGNTMQTWINAACVTDSVIHATARSVGMYIIVDRKPDEYNLPEDIDHTRLSSCTATLIAPDLIITAGHCTSTNDETITGSFTLDYQTECDRSRPVGYNPKFYKMKRLVKTGYQRTPGDSRTPVDYSIVQIETPVGGIGAPPVPSRPSSLPLSINEPLFIIHHRRGTVKKVSRFPTDATCIVQGFSGTELLFKCNVDYGASGSSVFDSSGRIVANLSTFNGGQSITSIWNDFLTEPPPVRDVDVVLVFDRSGSMSLTGLSGSTKIEEARSAAALFVSLLRTTATDRVGLVSFSTTPSDDFDLAAVNSSTKAALIGPAPPGTTGLVGGLTPGGSTTIGGGLQTAVLGLLPPPSPTGNTPAILLMTDGLENTPPMIADVEATLGATRLNIIGFGTEASLDGPRLTRLARDHGGIYTRANDGLSLKKFFALAFGRIFEFGNSLDPVYTLPANVMTAPPVPLNVCGETMLTAVLGWDNPAADLLLSLRTPGGSLITSTTPGVVAASGNTWAHLSISLPFVGERDGTWQVQVSRPPGGGEFPPPTPELRFFLTTLADGGPSFSALAQQHIYTGDVVNPKVFLREPGGGRVAANVTVDVELPTDGTGNVLTKAGLGQPGSQGGDQLDARSSTLIALEQAQGAALIKMNTRTVPLFDDGLHDDGGLESDGIFGNPLADLTRFEGNYTFHARATYGETCVATRETTWSVYVSVGIDPNTTEVTTQTVGTLPDGRLQISVTFTPRDKYGNYLGPGRRDAFEVADQPGSQLDGGVSDNGNGSYVQQVIWDPSSGIPPGLIVTQPGRPPVVVAGPALPGTGGKQFCLWLLLLAILLVVGVIVFWWKKFLEEETSP